jgi:hypothetical protein
MKIYKVLNPITGEYADTNNKEECLAALAETAWQFYLAHTHNQPYVAVTVNEDGSEVWQVPSGETILSPAQIEAAMADPLPQTLPVSILGE